MRQPALTLAEMGTARARREPAAPASDRPHVWIGPRCAQCGMHEEWAGARYACTGAKKSDRCAHRFSTGTQCGRTASRQGFCGRHRRVG